MTAARNLVGNKIGGNSKQSEKYRIKCNVFSQIKVYTNKLFVTEPTSLMQTYTSQELREVKLLGIIYYDTNIIISTLFTFYSNIKMFHVSQQLTVVLKLSARSYQDPRRLFFFLFYFQKLHCNQSPQESILIHSNIQKNPNILTQSS